MKVSEIMTSKNLVTIPSTSTVADALSRMRNTGIHQVPVLNGKRYSGMLSYREILRRRSIRSNSKVETFMIKTAKLTPNTDVKSAVKLLRDSGLAALPVVEAGHLAGILSRTDILKNLSRVVPSFEMKCFEVMSSDPVLIHEDEPLYKALEKFRSLDVSEMPVASASGSYLGVLRVDQISQDRLLNTTERVTTGEVVGEAERTKINIGSLGLKHVKADPDMSVEKCALLLVENKIRAIPVVDSSNKVVGIIDSSDIIAVLDTGGSRDGILIQVSGLEPWDDDLYDILYHNASKLVAKLPMLAGMKGGHFDFHIAKYRSEGRTKFSVRTRLAGGSVSMAINDHDWKFGKCIDRIMETYENRLSKRREK